MYHDKIMLTVKDILEKDFKIDTRGYRPQEVDKYLDLIIKDYDEFSNIINALENEKKEIIQDNIRLKQEIRNLRTKLEIVNEGSLNDNTHNADVLRRLSNLEKIIYGKE